MEITKKYLKKIILEEISNVEEDDADEGRALEAPLAEGSWEIDQVDDLAKELHQTRRELHNLIMWAIDQGYSPKR